MTWSVDLFSVAGLLETLSGHENLAYLILFLRAFFETLIPVSFVVYGEIFFLSGAVFLARLAGPFSWIVPSLAGAYRLPYPTFIFYNVFGVVVGIGQFLLVGYFLGHNLEDLSRWLDCLGVFPVVLLLVVLGVLGWFSRAKVNCCGNGKI